MHTERDWQRVAAAVRRRRAAKDWTQMDVASRGPLSIDRVQAIEGARSTRYSPRTIANLERALEWKQGSVQAILDGGDPVPVAEPPSDQAGVALPSPPASSDGMSPAEQAAARQMDLVLAAMQEAARRAAREEVASDLAEMEERIARLEEQLRRENQ